MAEEPSPLQTHCWQPPKLTRQPRREITRRSNLLGSAIQRKRTIKKQLNSAKKQCLFCLFNKMDHWSRTHGILCILVFDSSMLEICFLSRNLLQSPPGSGKPDHLLPWSSKSLELIAWNIQTTHGRQPEEQRSLWLRPLDKSYRILEEYKRQRCHCRLRVAVLNKMGCEIYIEYVEITRLY